MIFVNIDLLLWAAFVIGRHRDLEGCALEMSREYNYHAKSAVLMASCNWRYKLNGRLALWDWLTYCVFFDVTDPRDRFFALVGLSFGIHPSFIDYKKDLQTIAIEMGLLALIGNPSYQYAHFGLHLLAWNQNPQNHVLGIPSWVPDLMTKEGGGRISLLGAYQTKALRLQRKIPKTEIRGLGVPKWSDVNNAHMGDSKVVDVYIQQPSTVRLTLNEKNPSDNDLIVRA